MTFRDKISKDFFMLMLTCKSTLTYAAKKKKKIQAAYKYKLINSQTVAHVFAKAFFSLSVKKIDCDNTRSSEELGTPTVFKLPVVRNCSHCSRKKENQKNNTVFCVLDVFWNNIFKLQQ